MTVSLTNHRPAVSVSAIFFLTIFLATLATLPPAMSPLEPKLSLSTPPSSPLPTQLPSSQALQVSASALKPSPVPQEHPNNIWTFTDVSRQGGHSGTSTPAASDSLGAGSSSGANLQPSSSANQVSALDKCDRLIRPEAICCRDLRGEDERHLIDPDIVRDVIIGLSDGLTVPFGLTAGLSSLGSSQLVVVGGLAELISGAISMGIGGYLASEAERDHFRYLQRTTRERVARSCSGEMEREVHEVLGPIGLDASVSRVVAGALMRVERENEGLVKGGAGEESLARWIMKCLGRNRRTSVSSQPGQSLRWSKDVGVTAFLLKFGEGLDEVPESRLYISAFTIGAAYFVGGLVPMAPYFFVQSAQTALYWSILIMLVTLFLFGVFKAYFTGAKIGFLGYLRASSSTIVVGGTAAAASWLIVKALDHP